MYVVAYKHKGKFRSVICNHEDRVILIEVWSIAKLLENEPY